MSSFTFLHAADIHLDSPLKGLDPEAPVERIRRATRDALVNMVDFAIEQQVSFVLLAGDLYDGDWKDWRTGQFLVQQLGRLVREGIEIVAISGNHDAESVLTLKLPVPGLLPVDKPGTRLLSNSPVAVHGQGFRIPAVTGNIVLDYPAPVDGRFNIGLLHTACGSSAHANYAPCSLDDLVRRNYDYWALGHVHTRSELCRDPWAVFPGNLQGRHINEEGSRGATMVTVINGRVASAAHHALDVLRWRRLQVHVAEATTRAEILLRVKDALEAAAQEAEGRLLVVRVVLLGECPAHADLVASPSETLNQAAVRNDEAGTPVAGQAAHQCESSAEGDPRELETASNMARLKASILANCTWLDQREACTLLGVSASDLFTSVEAKNLFGEVLRVMVDGRLVYPLFQFDIEGHRVLPAMVKSIKPSQQAGATIVCCIGLRHLTWTWAALQQRHCRQLAAPSLPLSDARYRCPHRADTATYG